MILGESQQKKIKNGIIAVPFVKVGKKFEFLILHRCLNWIGWEFPKGGIEKNESPQEAALRELEEETGIKKINSIIKLPYSLEWRAEGVLYKYIPFAVEVSSKNVKLQEHPVREHNSFAWLNFEKALEMLTHENSKKLLKDVFRMLETI